MSGTCIWHGEDGTPYEYRVYDLYPKWNDVPGNYIFAKLSGTMWVPLYIGETSNFEQRLGPFHERWEEAQSNGMTHIHAHSGSKIQETRRYEEWNLIRVHMPKLNQRAS